MIEEGIVQKLRGHLYILQSEHIQTTLYKDIYDSLNGEGMETKLQVNCFWNK